MKKILYVEDDPLIAKLYFEKLARAGFDVHLAEDGLQAMKMLVELKPDLLVLDLMMPKMTGTDVLKFIRGHPQLKYVRVIVFTNMFANSLAEQLAGAEVEMTLSKSDMTPAQMVDVVRKVLLAPSRALAPEAPVMQAARPQAKAPAPAAAPTPPPPASKPATPKPAQPAPKVPVKEVNEEDVRTRVKSQFVERIPAILKNVRELCSEFLEAADATTAQRRIEALARKVGFLSQMTALAGAHRLARLASALEALLFDLHEKPANINDSSRQTVVSAVAYLSDCLNTSWEPEDTEPPAVTALVVDDDPVSTRSVVIALNRAKCQAASSVDPHEALTLLGQKSFDLVLLDIDMPGMDGITLCEKMRELPHHKRTHVIFVTGLKDFNTRARSLLSGGNDLITKPILPLELTVKAITHLLKNPSGIGA